MNKNEFLDKIEDLLNAAEELPEDVEILSFSLRSGGQAALQVSDTGRLAAYRRVEERELPESGYVERSVQSHNIRVIQLDERETQA